MKKYILYSLLFLAFLIFGQNISGVVLDKMGVPVQFAYVMCKSNNKIVYSDENGCFKIEGGKVVFYDTIEVISVGFKKFQLPINSNNSVKEYSI
ncbi:MAG: carboxypeptidase-like regulatory domain-containing protein, partial [Bacteroidota bacterium]|nr:carboxypeptidase-like regulatory domain-containing protein [Bacteroidota bacterium]